jgi:Zn finger protein HypA/HybF involved in hydrogenase expression
MEMKTCTKCGVVKLLEAFPPVRRGEPDRQSWCRSCFAEANARNYLRTAEAVKARVRRRQESRRSMIRPLLIEYLRAHPCVDCGETDIVVLEFDHIGTKTAEVSALLTGGYSWDRILLEIEKCEVRCANCHRIKTSRDWPMPPVAPARKQRERRRVAQPSTEIRRCRVCGETKSLDDFPFRSQARQTRRWICLACQREYARAWYERNRERHTARVAANNARYRAEARAQIRLARANVSCIDCGETNPLVLDFDHLRDKKSDLNSLGTAGASAETIDAELAKCVVRCVNCHRRKTAKERGWFKTLIA